MPTMNRRAAKRDANEGDIIKALRKAGASVTQLSDRGVPDLLVGFAGTNYLMEVKMPKGGLTEDEQTFFDGWKGTAWLVRNAETALSIIGVPETMWPVFID